MSGPEPVGRRRARAAALQMLYQAEIGRGGVEETIETYWPAQDPDAEVGGELRAFANGLVRGVIQRRGDIDERLSARATNWRVERMAVIDRLVLRLAVFELLTEPDTPAKVVINEAIELARAYSGDESVGFVNGVLDAIRKDLDRQ